MLDYNVVKENFEKVEKQLKMWRNTEEYKNWKENPTEENLRKAKEKRKEIVK